MTAPDDELLSAWSAALPRVLSLLPDPQARMFRGELQRFLALRRMQPAEAEAAVGPLRDLLLQSVRTAQIPAALHATRTHLADGAALERLITHVLTEWRAAAAAARGGAKPAPAERSGEVFFGPRLGGPGRPGAVRAGDPPKD